MASIVRPVRFLSIAVVTALVFLACDSGDEKIRRTETGTVQLNPTTFLFPKMQVDEQNERMVVLKNVGQGPLLMTNILLDGSSGLDLFWFRGEDEDSELVPGIVDGQSSFENVLELQPEEAITLVVRFTAESTEPPVGRVGIETNDTQNRSVVIPIEGTDIGAELAVSPTTVNFGRQVANEEARIELTALNTGIAVLEISQFLLSGSEDFSVELNGGDPTTDASLLEDPDNDGTPGLNPDASFTFELIYLTDAPGPDDGELSIFSNGIAENVIIELSANSASPCIEINPTALAFEAGLVGQSTPRALTISSCGLEPLRIDDLKIVSEEGVFEFEEMSFPQLPLLLPPHDITAPDQEQPNRSVQVLFTPEEESAFLGTLLVESNDPVFPQVEIPLSGRGSQNTCPEARVVQEIFTVPPLEAITLDGSASSDPDALDGFPVRYEWTVIQRPAGSTSEPVERFRNVLRPQDGGPEDDPATPQAQFFVDIAGEYVIDLQVTDLLNATAPSEICRQSAARVRVLADPLDDIHLQLVWETPGDPNQTDEAGTDLDLHLLHPEGADWFDSRYDCSFLNATPDWGGNYQVSDDPSLDIDDRNGAGPENINLDNPQNTDQISGRGQYLVGVHYYRSTQGNFGGVEYGHSQATVRIYLEGVLAYEGEERLEATNAFWEVGGIVWTEEERRFAPINRIIDVQPWDEEP